MGLGCSPPSGTGLLCGAFVPRFPCTFGAAVTWGLYIPPGTSSTHELCCEGHGQTVTANLRYAHSVRRRKTVRRFHRFRRFGGCSHRFGMNPRNLRMFFQEEGGRISVPSRSRPRRLQVGGAVILLQNRRKHPTPPPVSGPVGLMRKGQKVTAQKGQNTPPPLRSSILGHLSAYRFDTCPLGTIKPTGPEVGGGRNLPPCKELRCARRGRRGAFSVESRAARW